MNRLAKAIIATVVLAVPIMAATQSSAASCVPHTPTATIHSASFYECLGHSAKAAAWFASEYAAEKGSSS